MGRKKTNDDEKYLKRRRYYLKSKGYSDEEINDLLNETSKEPEFKGFFNDIELVNNFNKKLLITDNKDIISNNDTSDDLDDKISQDDTNSNTNDKTFTNTNDKTNDNVFVNDNVNDNVKFEFDDNLKNEDSQFTEQQQQATNEQSKDVKEDKEGGSISGKMFMLTFNVLLTTASKFVKKDLTFDNDEINEFSKLYDEAYPEGLPISPKYVFWGGIIVTISTKALKK